MSTNKRDEEKRRLVERLRQISEEEDKEKAARLAWCHEVALSLLPQLAMLAGCEADRKRLVAAAPSADRRGWPENLRVELYVDAESCYVTVTEE